MSPFFFLLPVYLPFIAVLSLFFARLHGLKATRKFSEIEIKLVSPTKRAFFLARNYFQKGRYKNQKESQSYFPSFTHLSSFHCRPVSIFCPFTWLGSGLKV